ncbi:MAG: YncE family protein, partial [Gammaproteobacteria bacterium]|nr:YncE family protein [Gammaproteobacteria bacterium]
MKHRNEVKGAGSRIRILFGSLLIMLCMIAVSSLEMLQKNSAWVSDAWGKSPARGRIVVADRVSGTISIIDTETDELVNTVPLPDPVPDDGLVPQPMYVVHVPSHKRVFVGDRTYNQVVVFNALDFSVESTVPAGNGVFHMWGDQSEQQLWVNNDIDKTVTVIDTITLEVITTVPIPANLVAAGGIPHDVILDPVSRAAFVTILGIAVGNDVVVKFSTETFEEVGRVEVGQDPHLSLARQNNLLYVPCQGTSELFILNRETLDVVDVLDIPNTHGAGMARNGKTFYTTNIAGGGTDG